jgi:hypothetical protein
MPSDGATAVIVLVTALLWQVVVVGLNEFAIENPKTDEAVESSPHHANAGFAGTCRLHHRRRRRGLHDVYRWMSSS